MIEMVFGLIATLITLAIVGGICLGGFFILRKLLGSDEAGGDGKSGSQFSLAVVRDSLFFRISFAGLLIIVSLIPLSLVEGIISERSYLYSSVSKRMTQEWSGYQHISGPVLTVPYEYTIYVTDKTENKESGEIKYTKRAVTRKKDLHILPEALDIKSSLQTSELKRGIYTVPIYESQHAVSGSFLWPDLSGLTHVPEKILWEKAIVTFMISSTKGITGTTELLWGGKPMNLSAGTGLDIAQNGIHARLKLNNSVTKSPTDFSLKFNLRGSKGLNFAPTGRNSKIALNADWPHPSFKGQLLPTSRNVQDTQFEAGWDVAHLSRSYSQLAAHDSLSKKPFFDAIYQFNFGADLFQTVDLYTLLNRTVKYGVLFIALTFFTLFIVEFSSGVRFHWLQHLMIGGALSMFYLCVLALSEHINFMYAYLAGVFIIALMVGLYTRALIGKGLYGLSVAGVMLSLYAVLYSILQMEDFALLIGTSLLLVFLGIGMFMTRKLHKQTHLKD